MWLQAETSFFHLIVFAILMIVSIVRGLKKQKTIDQRKKEYQERLRQQQESTQREQEPSQVEDVYQSDTETETHDPVKEVLDQLFPEIIIKPQPTEPTQETLSEHIAMEDASQDEEATGEAGGLNAFDELKRQQIESGGLPAAYRPIAASINDSRHSQPWSTNNKIGAIDLRTAIIASEVLGKPLSKRRRSINA